MKVIVGRASEPALRPTGPGSVSTVMSEALGSHTVAGGLASDSLADPGAMGSPGPPRYTQVEGRCQHHELGPDLSQATQQEPPCPQLLFKNAKDRLDQSLAPGVPPSGPPQADHPSSMFAEQGIGGPDPQGASGVPVFGTYPVGCAGTTHGSLGVSWHDPLPPLHQLGIFVRKVHPPKPLPSEMVHGAPPSRRA